MRLGLSVLRLDQCRFTGTAIARLLTGSSYSYVTNFLILKFSYYYLGLQRSDGLTRLSIVIIIIIIFETYCKSETKTKQIKQRRAISSNRRMTKTDLKSSVSFAFSEVENSVVVLTLSFFYSNI